jgi:predicted AAA+ superfamily ATPase
MRSNVGTKNAIYNVLQYGARGDGKSDDSRVYISMLFLFNQIYVYIS